MTDQREPEQGGVATMEPESANAASANAVTQSPLDADGNASPPTRAGASDRKAARALKRAERAERRPERNGRHERNLDAVVAPPAEPARPTAAAPEAGADASADASAVEPLTQEAMPEPEPEAPAIPEVESAPASDSLVAASDHAGEDAAPTEPTAASGREGNPKRAERLERKAARRGDAQNGAEPAPSREERR
ncbi:MAG TPA: hypothetical protein VFI22_08450, partial [Thermomicrobiales bacterium]|nr:hypothetical protein [Thermomicrobiales bacterium]